MSLDREAFLREWLQLEGSFSRTLSKNIRDAWYTEVELSELHIFKKTIRRLAMGFHFTQKSSTFPRFKDYHTVYKMTLNELRPSEEASEKVGCVKCVDGRIYFEKQYRGYSETHTVVGFCRNCHPITKRTIDPNDVYNYTPGMHPDHRRHRIAIPPEVNRELYLDFMKKWRDPATDWEKETQEALDKHRQGVEALGLK